MALLDDLDRADRRTTKLKRSADTLDTLSGVGPILDRLDTDIGSIVSRNPEQYSAPLMVAAGPATGRPSMVNAPSPQAVEEADIKLPPSLRGLEAFKEALGIPARPTILEEIGIGRTGRHTMAEQLYQTVLADELKNQLKDLRKNRMTIEQANAQIPGAIQPNMQQTMAGFPSPTWEVPSADTSPFSVAYPENQTSLPAPKGKLDDVQEAVLGSVLSGHILTGDQQQQYTNQLTDLGRLAQAPRMSGTGGPADVTLPDVGVGASPIPRVPLPIQAVTNLGNQYAEMVKTGMGKPAVEIKPGADGAYYRIDKSTGAATKIDKVQTPVEGQVGQLQAAETALKALQDGGLGDSEQAKHLKDLITKITTSQPNTVVNVNNKQEAAFEQELGKKNADAVVESRKTADEAVQMINTVTQGRNILESGMMTGFGAEALVKFGQALRAVGIDFGGTDLENSQAYAALMAQNVGKVIKQFGSGTGLSNADREYAEKMAGGKITLDQKAIEKILDMQERAARNLIRKHNQMVKGIKSVVPLEVEEPVEMPRIGEVRKGYRFKGGDPTNQKSWEKVQP